MKSVMDVMTKDVETIGPNDTLKAAAEKMRELSVGPLPVCEGDKLMGIITDRDIVVRAVAKGMDINTTRVSEAMTDHVESVHVSDDITTVSKKMNEEKIRRVLVVDDHDKLVGIIALGDLVEAMNTEEAGKTLETISEAPPPGGH
jgi:CBS domain-containing protein